MRTVRQWRRQARRDLQLRRGIRPLLEATYDDSTPETGAAWRFFAERLAARRAKLEARAELAANVRGQPLAEDREGIGTRYSEVDYVNLLILRGNSGFHDESEFQVQLAPSDTKFTVTAWRFDPEIARNLHRNVVRIPRWWWGRNTPVPALPSALAQYFHEPTLPARQKNKRDDGDPEALVLQPPDSTLVIAYHRERGVWLKQPRSPKLPTPDEDDYEFQSDD
jgi:hypothetical protein